MKYYDRGEVLEAHIGYPALSASSSVPAVLVCHDWSGRNAFADSMADQMAEWGYVGFALDVYGEGKQTHDDEKKTQWMSPFIEQRAHLLLRLKAALHTVCLLPMVNVERIAVIGFCFGGLCALDLARSGANLCAAVSVHGILTPPHSEPPSQKIQAKILALHGYDDPMVNFDHVRAFTQEMTAAEADWQLHVYGRTQHAFTNPLANNPGIGTVYNEVSAVRSKRIMQDFLREVFSV